MCVGGGGGGGGAGGGGRNCQLLKRGSCARHFSPLYHVGGFLKGEGGGVL